MTQQGVDEVDRLMRDPSFTPEYLAPGEAQRRFAVLEERISAQQEEIAQVRAHLNPPQPQGPNIAEELRSAVKVLKAPKPGDSAIKVNKPKAFDGTITKSDEFLYSLALVFAADKHKFETSSTANANRVTYALSFMSEGNAWIWGRNYLKSHTTIPTWAEFEADFKTAFGDPFPQATAQLQLSKLRQNASTVDDYIATFEKYQHDTDYNDTALLVLFKQGLDPNINRQVHCTNPFPTTLATFKDAARRVDRTWRQFGAENQVFRRGPYVRPAAPTTYAPRPTLRAPVNPQAQFPAPRSAPAIPATDRRDNTGVTFGGVGQPMDVDAARRAARKCYLCGQPGHMAAQCPTRQPRRYNVRELASQLTPDEVEELVIEADKHDAEARAQNTMQDLNSDDMGFLPARE